VGCSYSALIGFRADALRAQSGSRSCSRSSSLYVLSMPIVAAPCCGASKHAYVDPAADARGGAIVVLGGVLFRAPEYGMDYGGSAHARARALCRVPAATHGKPILVTGGDPPAAAARRRQ
jgi:hypothetical protein